MRTSQGGAASAALIKLYVHREGEPPGSAVPALYDSNSQAQDWARSRGCERTKVSPGSGARGDMTTLGPFQSPPRGIGACVQGDRGRSV